MSTVESLSKVESNLYSGKDPTFLELVEVKTPIDTRLDMCIQCGTCSGTCPAGPDMDFTPRHIFAMIRAGWKDEVLRSNTPWYCVSCYHCVVRCPQEVKITDIMYTLKRMAISEGLYKESTPEAPDLAGFFMDYVENYGRSFELGLATRFHLRRRPLSVVKLAPLGLGMWRKGRIDLTPNRIKNLKQFKAILSKARELGGSS